LDFVALCGLGNTLGLSRIDAAVADDPQVLREAVDAISKTILSKSARRQERFMPGISAGGEGKGASPAFLMTELSRSARHCHVP